VYPFPAGSVIEPDPDPQGSGFDRPSGSQEALGSAGGEIDILCSKAEDRRVEWIEGLDLELDRHLFASFGEAADAKRTRSAQV
jgi:hypothetical protein